MVPFSCADFAFPLLRHEDSLRLIKMLGIDWVDVGLFENRSHIQPSGELKDPEKSGKSLADKAANLGLGIADIFLQTSLDFREFAINHPDARIRAGQRDVFRRLCDYVLAAGCRHVGGLPGVDFGGESWALGREELLWRADYARERGLTYAVEAHAGSLIESPDDTLKMLKEAEGLSLILDHSHYTFRGIPASSLRPLMPYAAHMHIRGARKGEMQCSVARNETDFQAVADHMRETGYAGKVCLEYTYTDWENCNRTDNLSETILLAREFHQLLES